MHHEVLRSTLGLTIKKIPYFTHIRRILIGILREVIEAALRTYSALLISNEECTPIYFDGKTLCGSGDQNGMQMHLFNAFESLDSYIINGN